MVFTFQSYGQIESASNQRKNSRAIVAAAHRFIDHLKDAEIGQRSFVLTGEEAYLAPYLAQKNSLQSELQALRASNNVDEANVHLDAVATLLDIKMADMARGAKGDGLMDGIRAEFYAFDRMQDDALQHSMTAFDSSMRRMFAGIVSMAVLGVLFALYFVRQYYRAGQQLVRTALHQETQHRLAIQTASNRDLSQTNYALQVSQEKLAVTLDSIGDAVIATDANTHITLLNRVAEDLTGWTQGEALGLPLDAVFCIIAKDSRMPTTLGLATPKVLVARDGREFDIADSCAPIRDSEGDITGAVLVFRNVTSEYAAQQALRDSTTLVKAILNTVVDGIVTLHANEGCIESANAAVERLFGYTCAELYGQTLNMLIPELGHGAVREVTGRRKDGSIFPLEIAVNEMTLCSERYLTVLLRDITMRKHSEAALRKSSALQHAIFNSANFSYVSTDAQGLIQVFNVGAEQMLGYTAQEMVGRNTPASFCSAQELVWRSGQLRTDPQAPELSEFESLVYKASRGAEDIFEINYVHKNRSMVPVVVSINPLSDDDGTVIGYLLVGIDNRTRRRLETERTQLNQALHDRNKELETARAVAERANQAKSEFLSSMSHELRSPLNAILGFAQLMESGLPVPTPEQQASIAQILRAGWYLLELINEVLDLALVESGRLSMSIEPVRIADALADCKTMMEPLASARGIGLQFPLMDAASFAAVDRMRFKQVLVNLLSNAIKYNRPNGMVHVTCQQTGAGRVQIRVRDTGFGLPAAKLEQLFEPFNRLGQEVGVEDGTGIGLVVCKRLVELMGGQIGATSNPGEGSEFWIELNQADPPLLLAASAMSDRASHPQVAPCQCVRTVLYVEDNQANAELVTQIMARRPDVRLLLAGNGLHGVALASAELPDLILMDINLPGMSGLQALQLLRENSATRHIPVIALSANAMPHDIDKALESGCIRYLTKPIKLVEFLEALEAGFQASPTGPHAENCGV